MTVDRKELERVCEVALAASHYDLVALEFGREQAGWILRVFIDRPEGGNVSVEDCGRASRDVSTALDVADLIDHAYSLEVSSPGLDRPLTKERDFARFEGQVARIKTRLPIDGRRNFKGTLRGAQAGRLSIECDGKVFEVPIDEVQKANLEHQFGNSAKE